MIDGGPSRTSRAADMHAVRRPEPTRQEPQSTATSTLGTPPSQAGRQPAALASKSKLWPILISVFVLIVAAATAWWLFVGRGHSLEGVDSGKYQAVFLSSGQVYFGKLEPSDRDYLTLTGVFYIQSQSQQSTDEAKTQSTESDAGMQLIKLGDEVHGPEDAMIINRDQVLFIENLKPSGKVAGLIDQYRQGKQ